MKTIEDYQKEADKFNIKGLLCLTPYDVYNLIVSAYEGGSTYWADIGSKSYKRMHEATKDMEGQPTVDRFIMAIQRGTVVNIYDIETREKLGTLTPESWAKAEQLMMKKYRRHFADAVGENGDAITGDVFLQLAVMGDVVYG